MPRPEIMQSVRSNKVGRAVEGSIVPWVELGYEITKRTPRALGRTAARVGKSIVLTPLDLADKAVEATGLRPHKFDVTNPVDRFELFKRTLSNGVIARAIIQVDGYLPNEVFPQYKKLAQAHDHEQGKTPLHDFQHARHFSGVVATVMSNIPEAAPQIHAAQQTLAANYTDSDVDDSVLVSKSTVPKMAVPERPVDATIRDVQPWQS